MGQAALKLCYYPSCTQTVAHGVVYCNKHKKHAPVKEKRFYSLTKYQEHRKLVYGTTRWTKLSKIIRMENPLCEDCYKKGIRTKSELIHHVPDVTELIEKGLDPFDRKYLHAICNNCHMSELRKRRK